MAPPRRVFAALTASALLMLLSLTVLASNAPANQPLDRRGNVIISPSATNNFDQLVVVLMENKNLNEVYGPAPYMTQLADQYSFSQGWSSITNPSQPNYIAIMGASTFGGGGDGNHPNREVRMVPVAADAERARAHDRDVVRLRRIRDARPTLGERVLVGELRHVRSRAVDLVQVLVLHEDDDELVEVVRCGGRDYDAATPVKRLTRRRIRGKNREAQEHEEGGGRKGRKYAPRGSHSVFSRRLASSVLPVMLVFSRPTCSDNRYG